MRGPGIELGSTTWKGRFYTIDEHDDFLRNKNHIIAADITT